MSIEHISTALQIQGISSTEKFVLVALANRANHNGECWPSFADIERQTCLSRSSVIRAIQDLESGGFVKKSTRELSGRQSSNLYILTMSGVSPVHPPSVTVTPPPVSPRHPPSVTVTPEPILNLNTEPSVKEAFAKWYQNYPHKIGRLQAEKAFIGAIKKTDLETLQAGLEAYKKSKPADRAWCNPSTWLNQERWSDQPAEVSAVKLSDREKARRAMVGNY